MALDKLVDGAQLDADLASVAGAIRTKGGTSAQLAFPAGFVSAIDAIPTGGGGISADDWLDGNVITSIDYDGTAINDYKLYGQSALTTLNAPNLTAIRLSAMQYCSSFSGPKVFPKITTLGNYAFSRCAITALDFSILSNMGLYTFERNSQLNVLVLRRNTMTALPSINAFNNTPFASGNAGGTLYVPASLVSQYAQARNWSTILGYANNQIKSIESTATDPTAPVDLTTHYIDGTLIPT